MLFAENAVRNSESTPCPRLLLAALSKSGVDTSVYFRCLLGKGTIELSAEHTAYLFAEPHGLPEYLRFLLGLPDS
jgi:hypothetical protein